QRLARQVDAVLFSHPDMAHLGAYPLAFSYYGLTCPAYATQAVHMMGRMCMKDAAMAFKAREEGVLFDEKDVDQAFENITPLQYFQPKSLPGEHHNIVVTAHSAGHTIGGTMWTISNGAETVLYAIDFNHMKEEHLNRCSLMEGDQGKVNPRLMRPTLLITDSYNALYKLPTRKKRVECFLDSVNAGIKRGGNVLIPVDSAARVLEIAYILNDWWHQDKGKRDTHSLFFLSKCGRKVKSFAQSLTGWMASSIEEQLLDKDTKPFDLRYVTIVQSMEELDKKTSTDSKRRSRSRKAVVMATTEGMSLGFSQELFLRWAADKRNAIVLPQRGAPSSLTRELFTRWFERTQRSIQPGSAMKLGPPIRLSKTEINITVKKRVPLKGKELEDWLIQDRQRKEQEAAREAIMKRKRDMIDSDDMNVEAISEIDLETERLLSGQTYDLYIKGRGLVRGLHFLNKSYCMFPFQEKIRRTDEYGEIYDPEDYMVKADHEDATLLLDIDKPYESDNEEEEEDTRPTKPVKEQRRVQINCLLAFVDMEGRTDGTSASNIIVLLTPKRLVIVHGTHSSSKALSELCRGPQSLVNKEIYMPGIGETLNVSSGINVYKIKLTDALFKQAQLLGVQDKMAGFVSGCIKYSQDDELPVLD
ncbi:beta-lactamase-like protein, partial [Coemansia spiralis]